jgi:Outer membrane protein beta-barrel domain
MSGRLGTALTIAATLSGQPVLAQDKPKSIVEAVVGRSGFIDEVWDYFGTIGGGVRVFVTPRLAIGPEVAYLSGEFDALEASNLTVTANMTFDIARDDGRRRVVPYLAAGGGYLRQKTLVGSGAGSTALVPFTSSEGTMSAGFGARIALGSHVFVAPEFRLGWEPETRIAITIGIRFR